MKINQDQVNLSRWQKIKFDYRRGSGHLLRFLVNRFRWHYYPRFQFVSKFPDHVDIEISSACNMKCPMCYTITDEFRQKVKKEFMELDLFKKIIDECAEHNVYSIRISLRGEPFLNKDVIRMIKYAKEKGIKEVSSLTNNLAIDPDLFKQAMQAGLDWLTISFDGLGEMYESIRKPAKFGDSYEKIKVYWQIKKEARSLKPVIKIQTVWPAIKRNAKEYFEVFNPYVDHIAINPLIDYLRRDKEEDIIYLNKFICPVLYQRMVIGSDGSVLLCSNDELCLYKVGDVNTDSLYRIWHGKELNRARQIHKEYMGTKLLEPCKYCYLPRKTQPAIENFGERKITIDKYVNRPDAVGI